MSRIVGTQAETATPDQRTARAAIKEAWGRVPNLGDVISLSLPLTRAVLAFDEALAGGTFGGITGELLSIAVSEENRCAYCLAAHSTAARAIGANADDVASARTGDVADAKDAAALRFAQEVVRRRGHVPDATLAAVTSAGWTQAEVVEIVGHVAATILSNYLHHLSQVPVDYPPVSFARETASDPQ